MKNAYWNDIASKGAVLGVLMLASHIFEQWCIQHMSMGGITMVGVEMLAVAALYIVLLYRFAKQAAAKFADPTLGFSYSQGLLYVVYTSLFAGVIVGFGGYLYLHYAVGYETYVEQMVENLQQMIYETGASSAIMSMYDGMFAGLLEQPEPGIFSTIISSILSYSFWGLIIGLFIASAVKREPQLFDNNGTEEDI